MQAAPRAVRLPSVPLERDVFLRTLMRDLAGTLQDVVGLERRPASSRRRTEDGDRSTKLRAALAVDRLDRPQVAAVLVDLKRASRATSRVVEERRRSSACWKPGCPFGEKVLGRPAICMMTSNVFGSIAAENLGYAKVGIEKAIARGDEGCRIVVYLRPSGESRAAEGREYVRP